MQTRMGTEFRHDASARKNLSAGEKNYRSKELACLKGQVPHRTGPALRGRALVWRRLNQISRHPRKKITLCWWKLERTRPSPLMMMMGLRR